MPTHPGIFVLVIIWDAIQSHHKFEHSPAYGPFLQAAMPLIAGDIEIAHMDITDKDNLKKALESPVTQTSILGIKRGRVSSFLDAYDENFKKYIVGENYRGMWLTYAYEEPYLSVLKKGLTIRFSFYAWLGWDNEQDHYDVMKKDKYQSFRDSFKDCIVPEKGVKIHHSELKKTYGDW